MSRQIAIDVGSGFTKHTDGRTTGHLQSLVCPFPETDSPFQAETAQTVEVDGTPFLVGKEAKAFGDPSDLADTLHESWAGSQPWRALFYAAMANHLSDEEPVDAQVITGLPQYLYSSHRDSLTQDLEGEHAFRVGERSYRVTVRPHIAPQAAGPFFAASAQEPELMAAELGVIDIGTFTSGLATFQEGYFIASESGGVQIGVSNLVERLQEYMSREYGMHLDPVRAHRILQDRGANLRGQEVDLDAMIEDLAKSVARPLTDEIGRLWGGAHHLPWVFLAGGGGTAFAGAVRAAVPHAQVMSDAFYSVVTGLHVFLQGMTEGAEAAH